MESRKSRVKSDKKNTIRWYKSNKKLGVINIFLFFIIYLTIIHKPLAEPLYKQLFNANPNFGERANNVPQIPEEEFRKAEGTIRDKTKYINIRQMNRTIRVNIEFNSEVNADQAEKYMKLVNDEINNYRSKNENKEIFEVQYIARKLNDKGETEKSFPIFAMTPKGENSIDSFKRNKN